MSLDTATLERLRGQDAAHYLHPFTDSRELAAIGARVITHAEGIYVFDGEGRKILDGMSGLWCVNLGYGRREIADAVHRQMLELPYYNSFFQTTHPRAVELATRLATLAPAAGETRFDHVFFSSSGSESNDTNIRLVRRYWDLMGQPQRKTLISRWNGYHGSTIGGASLSGMSGMHSQGDLPIPGVAHIMQPFAFEHAHPGESRDDFGLRAARALEEKILELGPDTVAAFIAEPVQGAGGVIIPPDSYWPEIQRIVDKYGILLISDEVICAFGRLGHWFAYEKFGYRPDLVTFAKGVTSGYVPLGGVMVGSRVAKVLVEQGGEFNHGYTYSGHPVACQAALTTLDIMQAEGLVERVRSDTGPWLAQGFAALADHPLVGLAESCGMVAGLQLVRDRASNTLFDSALGVGMLCRGHCFNNGVIMRAVGDRMIIAPPLVMTRSDIDELLRLIRHALDLTLADVRARGWL
ncbi:aspartate aminotransferase family protein [Amphibiibacter pelophylacis]|uniref:Aspartate aminotransferase family protein n=1 Tax=Amphibiibacter pelophylacis TaxID=1799477 RepID=A0ACC6NZK4_9BURK